MMPGKYKEKVNTNPGPGYYQSEKKLGKSPSTIIGNTLRRSIFAVVTTPGPGDYVTEQSSVNHYERGATMLSKSKTRVEYSPGPNTYRAE